MTPRDTLHLVPLPHSIPFEDLQPHDHYLVELRPDFATVTGSRIFTGEYCWFVSYRGAPLGLTFGFPGSRFMTVYRTQILSIQKADGHHG